MTLKPTLSNPNTVADLSKEVDANKLIESTVSKFGRLDILVNNAGVIEMGSIEQTSLDQYDRVMNGERHFQV